MAKSERSDRLRVSVIIPAYNAEATIVSTVKSALNQTRPPEEIIIVDDGSQDDTVKRVKKLDGPIKLFQQKNKGSAAARNLAIKHSSGNILAFLDADDLWLADKLEQQCGIFSSFPDVDFCFANVVNQFPEGLRGKPFIDFKRSNMARICSQRYGAFVIFQDSLLPYFLIDNHAHTQTICVRRELVLSVGGFDESLRVGQDLDLWLRAVSKAKSAYIDKVLCYRRIHDHNITRENLRIDLAQIDILHRWLFSDVSWEPGQRAQFLTRLARLDYSVGRRLLKKERPKEARLYLWRSLHQKFVVKKLLLIFLTWSPSFLIILLNIINTKANLFRQCYFS